MGDEEKEESLPGQEEEGSSRLDVPQGDAPPNSATETPPLKSIVEALLFAANEVLSLQRLRACLGGASATDIREAIQQLNTEYSSSSRPFVIEEIAEGFRMYTRPEYQEYVGALFRKRSETRLSLAALETLAIIAYRQPVERAVIEDIRGVDTDAVLKTLMDRDLVRIVGRSEKLGRPLLFGTTKTFLEHFGLKSVKDLPKGSELSPP